MARYPQSDRKAVRASAILSDPGSALGGTLEHAAMLLKMQQLLSGAVEPSLADRLQVANVRHHRLILLAPSAAWATRLRMETPRLLEALHQAGFAELSDIEIRVAPLVEQAAAVHSSKPLSTAARQALDSMARLGSKSEE
jgi:hypothetical protein